MAQTSYSHTVHNVRSKKFCKLAYNIAKALWKEIWKFSAKFCLGRSLRESACTLFTQTITIDMEPHMVTVLL